MSLIDAARAVRENAYVPYSHFKVGAAVRGPSLQDCAGSDVQDIG